MEAQIVPKHGIPIQFIQISGLRGKGISSLLTAPFKILRAIFQAKKIIKHYRPNVVLGMGVCIRTRRRCCQIKRNPYCIA